MPGIVSPREKRGKVPDEGKTVSREGFSFVDEVQTFAARVPQCSTRVLPWSARVKPSSGTNRVFRRGSNPRLRRLNPGGAPQTSANEGKTLAADGFSFVGTFSAVLARGKDKADTAKGTRLGE